MALIRLPDGTQMSGSIGGRVFSHNRGGPYVRTRAVPTNPQSQAQMDVRQALGYLSSLWSAKLTADKDAWTQWAIDNPVTNRLGEPITLDGHQAFIQLNSRLQRNGIAINAAPPVGAPPAPLTTASVAIADAETDFTVTFTPTPLTGLRILTWWGGLHAGDRADPFTACRLLLCSAAAPTSPATIPIGLDAFQDQFFTVWLQTMNISGQVSVPARYSDRVSA